MARNRKIVIDRQQGSVIKRRVVQSEIGDYTVKYPMLPLFLYVAIAPVYILLFVTVFSFSSSLNLMSESTRWPKVKGVVVAAKVRTERSSEGEVRYYPQVLYKYKVNGSEYTGTKIMVSLFADNRFLSRIFPSLNRNYVTSKKEARKIYEEAKRQGHQAALLTQERPNVFTQRVANIEPGTRIDVQISYFSPLRVVDGEYEFVFPMVVGPRYNPAGQESGIGAAPRGEKGTIGQKTEVQYLKPGERSGHDIAVQLDIRSGLPSRRCTA